MDPRTWVDSFPGAVTVCNAQGIIVEMNAASARMFEKDGGMRLIGSNLLDCHPSPAREKLAELLRSPRVNVYTIEKNGKKKMIYQTPCYDGEVFTGLVELALEIPFDMPHFIRGNSK